MRRALLLVALLAFSCCGQQLPPIPGSVKVYQVNEPKGGLVRLQVQEVKAFTKAKGFFCQSPEHFQQTVTCTAGAAKVYYLRPDLGGLYRKQANELLTYAEGFGYFCVSPADLAEIIDECSKP